MKPNHLKLALFVVLFPSALLAENCDPQVGQSIQDFNSNCPNSMHGGFATDFLDDFSEPPSQSEIKFLHTWYVEPTFPQNFWGFINNDASNVSQVNFTVLGDGRQLISHFVGQLEISCVNQTASWVSATMGQYEPNELNVYELEAEYPAQILQSVIKIACDG